MAKEAQEKDERDREPEDAEDQPDSEAAEEAIDKASEGISGRLWIRTLVVSADRLSEIDMSAVGNEKVAWERDMALAAIYARIRRECNRDEEAAAE